MHHLFIHAPPRNGAQGILLFHREQEYEFTSDDIYGLVKKLFPRHDRRKLILHFNSNVTSRMVAEYKLRIEQGMMQRYSIEETFEDLHRDEWLKIIRVYYPELAAFADFIFEVVV